MAHGSSDSGVESKHSGAKKKRKITEDRRKQNRESQRRFRQRRREKACKGEKDCTNEDKAVNAALNFEDLSIDCQSEAALPFLPDSLTLVGDLGTVDCVQGLNAIDNSFDVNNVFDTSLVLDEAFESSPDLLPQDSWNATSNLDIMRPKANLAAYSNPGYVEPTIPSPYMNHFTIQKLNLIAAILQNALSIGVPTRIAEMQRLISPFYEDNSTVPALSSKFLIPAQNEMVQSSGPDKTCKTRSYNVATDIKPDLIPTALQKKLPHELYIDVIPFPVLRDRIITLLSMDPPAFDEMELKRDLHSEGLMVWGNGGRDATWDPRNWEAPKWFLDKWKILVNGSGLEEQSEWWRRMRGEEDIVFENLSNLQQL